MKISIIEDDEQELNNLVSCIDDFFRSRNISFNIERFTNSDTLLQKSDSIDLAFLDIQIGEKSNGIDIGIELRKRNKDVKIIFVTNYSEYLIEGYKAHADRYFIKPISQKHFDIEISNVIEDYFIRFAGFIDYKISNHKIYYKDIMYIEFSDRKTIIHFVNGEIIHTTYPLHYWKNRTYSQPFAQTYKSIIVNLNQISGFSKNDIILINNETIPLSKHYKKEFETLFSHNLHKRV